jgi:hypothetical protein
MKMQLILMLAVLVTMLALLVLPTVRAVLKQFTHNLAFNSYGDTGVHADGVITRLADAVQATRYVLVTAGTTAASTIAVCGKTDLPLGICQDCAEAIGDPVNVAVLGAAKGTRLMVASGVIAAGVKVYTDAAGKVTSTLDAAQYLVGISLSAAAADGDVIEVAHAVPLLMTSTLTTVLPIVVDADGLTITSAQSGSVISNLGASGAAVYALPAATAGLHYRFAVEAAQELRIDPNGSETIALPSSGVQGAAGKYLTADAIGERVHLCCISAGTWDVLDYAGTWTAES